MAPYWHYAIELFPEFKKKRIPIARFMCRRRRKTFSLLPTQLIPYFQYTVGAVMGTLFFGDGMLADGTEGVSWRVGESGRRRPGEFGDPVVNHLLAGRGGPRASPWPCRVEAVLQSGRHPHLRSLGRSGGLLCRFWIEAEDR